MIVFVYGTLKRGGRGNISCRMADQKFVCKTVGRCLDLYLVDGAFFDFPAALPGDRSVCGELWDVDEATFARMTRFEGGLYTPAEIQTDHGPAVTFLWNQALDTLTPILGNPATFPLDQEPAHVPAYRQPTE